MIVFAIMAYFYKPAQQTDDKNTDIPLESNQKDNQGFHKD